MNTSEKKSKLNQLQEFNEEKLRELLAELFRSKGFKDVEITHGPTELGKDIVFSSTDPVGRKKWTACVVKAETINQSVYQDVTRQVGECFRAKLKHHLHGDVKIDDVIVVTNKSYRANVRAQIADQEERKVTCWDGSNLIDQLTEAGLGSLVRSRGIDLTRFCEHVERQLLQHDNLKFLETDFGVNLDTIEDFEIKLRAKTRAFEKERDNYLDTKTRKVKELFFPDIDNILSSNRPVFIKGIATSGKSTFLKSLGRKLLKRDQDAVVFFIELYKYYSDEKKPLLENVIRDIYRSITDSDFSFDSKYSKVLILLDGLDEISNDKARDHILNEIKNCYRFEKIQIILSSRPNEHNQGNQLLDDFFDSYELLPLSVDEMIQIGNKVIKENDSVQNFIHLIRKSEIVKSFPKTPLTTILLAILFKEKKIDVKELPRNLTELYQKFVDVFLNKWDKSKGISGQYTIQQKEFVLQKIAEYMHKKKMVSISEPELIQVLSDLSGRHSIDSISNPEDFLSRICQRTDIIIKNDNEKTYRFFHLTLQEFLTASVLDRDFEDDLLKNFLSDWWLNPNIFYAGKTPYKSAVLTNVANFRVIPTTPAERLSFLINTSKVLQAAHLLDNKERKFVLESMIIAFDELVREIVNILLSMERAENSKMRSKNLYVHMHNRVRRRTLLDIIIWARDLFVEFFSSTQFRDPLKALFVETLSGNSKTDVTKYAMAFGLSVLESDSDYLFKFITSEDDLNPRWYKIVDVDIRIKHLANFDKQVKLKIRRKIGRNKEYVRKQFNEAIAKHYNSITALKPPIQKKLPDPEEKDILKIEN